MALKIVIKDIVVSYRSRQALDDVTLELESGKVTAIVGPNGSGKTTLLRCLNKVLNPRKGVVMIDGKEISKISYKELSKRMSYVPQGFSSHFPLTVFEMVLMGRKPHISWTVGAKDIEIVSNAIKLTKIEELASRNFDELSGGERQRVVIARALAQDPEVLLLDEPTSNLDLRHQLEILSLIREVTKQKGLITIIALHDLNLAYRFSDEAVMLNNGQVYAWGTVETVLSPENVKHVYGVEAIKIDADIPYIVPVKVC